jgi:hypothetical protein
MTYGLPPIDLAIIVLLLIGTRALAFFQRAIVRKTQKADPSPDQLF